jgi:membrane associated rhomboid family serine protease
MVRRAKEKTAVLILTALLILFYLLADVGKTIGLHAGCSWGCRLAYPFLHASLLHVLGNCWCLLSLVFIYDVSWLSLLLAYVVAITYPDAFLSSANIVGLSGCVFFLFGRVALQVQRKLYYQCCMLSFIGIGFLFTNVAGWLHLYCYAVGLVVALLNTPFIERRRL